MLVFGLILVGIAVLLAAGVAASSGNSTTLEVFGLDLDMRASVVFFTGACTAAALIIGLWLVKRGLARGYRRRKEVRELRHQAKVAPVAALPSEDAPSESVPAEDVPTEETAAEETAAAEEVAEGNEVPGEKEPAVETVERKD